MSAEQQARMLPSGRVRGLLPAGPKVTTPGVVAPAVKILGRLELIGDGWSTHIAWRKVRLLLLALLVQRNRLVGRETLIDALWSGDPPSDPAASLRSYASMVHRAVELVPDLHLSSRPTGYMLHVDEGVIDAVQLVELVDKAGALKAVGADVGALECLDRGLSLVRGAPLEDAADAPFAACEIERLQSLVVDAHELRLELQLSLGRYDEVIHNVQALLFEYPYREHLWEMYALALVRAGRTAAALTAIDGVRRSLRDGFGLEIGLSLARLETDIRGGVGPPTGLRPRPGHAGSFHRKPSRRSEPRSGQVGPAWRMPTPPAGTLIAPAAQLGARPTSGRVQAPERNLPRTDQGGRGAHTTLAVRSATKLREGAVRCPGLSVLFCACSGRWFSMSAARRSFLVDASGVNCFSSS